MWLVLRIVDNVLTVYDVRGRRKFRSERRCNCSASSVTIDNVSPDFANNNNNNIFHLNTVCFKANIAYGAV